MKAVVTAIINGTLFYLTPDGTASDIPERAREWTWAHDATQQAIKENKAEPWTKFGIRWQSQHRMADGTLVEPPKASDFESPE